MGNQRDDPPVKRIPLKDLRTEPEAEALLESAAMELYMNLAIAMMGGKDARPAIEKLAELPLEERYVWRVASAFLECTLRARDGGTHGSTIRTAKMVAAQSGGADESHI